MSKAIIISPRPVFFNSMNTQWALDVAWQWFQPDEIEDGVVKYLQSLEGWRKHYTRFRTINWTVVNVYLQPDTDNDCIATILSSLQTTKQQRWLWSRPYQTPEMLRLPIYLKEKSDAVMIKLKHG